MRTTLQMLLTAAMLFPSGGNARGEVSYNRDVLPILASRCFACHGVDGAQRKADLRLDQPGGVDLKELAHRMSTSDPAEMMPPPECIRKTGHPAPSSASRSLSLPR